MERELNAHHRQQQQHQQPHQQQQQQQQQQRPPFGGIASDQHPHSSAEFLRQNPFVNHKSINQFRSKSRVPDDERMAIMREQQELEIAAGCGCVGDGCDGNDDDVNGDGDGGCDCNCDVEVTWDDHGDVRSDFLDHCDTGYFFVWFFCVTPVQILCLYGATTTLNRTGE